MDTATRSRPPSGTVLVVGGLLGLALMVAAIVVFAPGLRGDILTEVGGNTDLDVLGSRNLGEQVADVVTVLEEDGTACVLVELDGEQSGDRACFDSADGTLSAVTAVDAPRDGAWFLAGAVDGSVRIVAVELSDGSTRRVPARGAVTGFGAGFYGFQLDDDEAVARVVAEARGGDGVGSLSCPSGPLATVDGLACSEPSYSGGQG